MRIITLTTDFGDEDGYVGTMKGVILSIAPGCAAIGWLRGRVAFSPIILQDPGGFP